jgi:hypothetical protein
MSYTDDLELLINCDNTGMDCCDLFKQVVVVDSLGQAYVRMWQGNTIKSCENFVEADLEDHDGHRVFMFNHGLGTTDYALVVRDNNDELQTVTEEVIDDNNTYVIIDQVITGTWRVCAFA